MFDCAGEPCADAAGGDAEWVDGCERDEGVRPDPNLCSGVSAATAAADPGSRQGWRGDDAAEVTGEEPVQHPMPNLHAAHEDAAVETWEALFERDMAIILRRYLVENPPPKSSRLAADALLWAENLELLGRVRQVAGGVRRLRVA